ncbi:MAG: PEGA domain-containing protein [Nannocystaceae bacterium]|nr:PEGA domain-containing protein [Nannocystaceae bacterium]
MLAPVLAAAMLTAPAGPAPHAVPGPAVTEVAPEHREELAILAPEAQDLPQAKRLFAAGKQAAQAGRWQQAIQYFAEAYRYSGSPGQLYSMGRGHRELYFNHGRDPVQLRLALLRLRQYLDRSPSGRNQNNAQRFIVELESYVTVLEGFDDEVIITRLMVYSPTPDATVAVDNGVASLAPVTVDVEPGEHQIRVQAAGYHDVSRKVVVPQGTTVPLEVPLSGLPAILELQGPRGAEVFVDGDSQGRLPLPQAIEVDAGTHQVAVARAGRTPLIREFEFGRGESRRVVVNLPVTTQRKTAYAAIAVGGATVIASATLAGLSLRSQNAAREWADMRNNSGITVAQYDREQQAWAQRDARRTGAIVTSVVGLATIGVGVVLYLTDRPRLTDRLYRPGRASSSPAIALGRSSVTTGIGGRLGVRRWKRSGR